MATSSGSNPGNDEDIGNAASILKDQFSYLEENLHIDNTLASKLYGWKPSLLRSQEYKRIGALLDQGEDDKAFEKWYTFATGYSEELLKEFCKCLRKAGKDARPKLIRIADKIEAAMENYRSSRSAGTEENKIMAGSNPGRKRSAEQSIGSAKRTQPGKWSLADRCLFMSHSSQDKDTVDEIVQALRQSGINVWYDKDEIRTGHQWDKKISEDMPHMYGFICCMSEEFFDSDICYEELQAFRSARKDNSAIPKDSIFPVIVVDPPLFKGVRAEWRMALPTQIHYKKWTVDNDQRLFLKDMKDFVNGKYLSVMFLEDLSKETRYSLHPKEANLRHHEKRT